MFRLLCVYSLTALLGVSLAQLSNRTIDDNFGDSVTGALPQFEGDWRTQATCDCSVDLDSSKLFRGTWHGAIARQSSNQTPSVTLQFTGVAIYVFNVLAYDNSEASLPINADMTFYLDDELDDFFVKNALDDGKGF